MSTASERAFATWKRWDLKNPAFYDLFKRFTFEALAAGKTELSGWLIANRIRWETEVVTQGSEWKVPNGHIAYFTRLFMAEYPRQQNLFETRPLKHKLAPHALENWLYERVGLEPPQPDDVQVLSVHVSAPDKVVLAGMRVQIDRIARNVSAFEGAR